MEFTEIRYVVSDMVEAPQVLTVDSSGQTSYRSHTNDQMPENPEIGLYETSLDSSRIAAIEQLLSKWSLTDIPDHSRSMPEGSSGKMLIISTPYAEVTKQVGPADPIDPRLQEMLDFFDEIVKETMKFPRQVLRVSIAPPTLSGSDQISVDLKLSNTGSEPLYVRKPTDLVSQSDGWLQIEVWPAVPEPGSMWSEQKIVVEVEKAEPPGDTSAILLIAPGASSHFTLKGQFAGKSGRQVARVSYCNFTDWANDQYLVLGHVFSTPVEFDIP